MLVESHYILLSEVSQDKFFEIRPSRSSSNSLSDKTVLLIPVSPFLLVETNGFFITKILDDRSGKSTAGSSWHLIQFH